MEWIGKDSVLEIGTPATFTFSVASIDKEGKEEGSLILLLVGGGDGVGIYKVNTVPVLLLFLLF